MARLRARRSSMARTTSGSTGGPIPAAWERISARWSSSRLAAGIGVVASDPKPVETPYAGSSDSARRSTIAALWAIARRAPSLSVTLASSRATATTSTGSMPRPVSSTAIATEVSRRLVGARLWTAYVRLRVVAHPGREDLLEPGELGVGRLPRSVQPAIDRLVDRLQRALVDPAPERTAGDDPRGGVERELLRAGAVGLVVQDPVPDVVTAGDLGALGREAAVGRQRGLVLVDTAVRVAADVGHPVVDHLERVRSGIELRARGPCVREPDQLVRGVAVAVEHPLARRERLVTVVHVELFLQVVANIDQRD